MNNVIVALLNEEMTKINFVDLEKLYNFVVEKFFIWIHLGPQKLLWKNNLPRAKKMHTAKCLFAECQKKALGKDAFCRVPKNGTRQNTSLPSARKKALGKDSFCRVPKKNTRQSHLCRVPKKTLGKAVFAECPIKYTRQRFRHSAKCRFPIVSLLCFDQKSHFHPPF